MHTHKYTQPHNHIYTQNTRKHTHTHSQTHTQTHTQNTHTHAHEHLDTPSANHVRRSDGQQWGSFKEAGLDSLRESHRVNGQITFNSPFAARDHLDTLASRRRRAQQQGEPAAGGAGGGGAAAE